MVLLTWDCVRRRCWEDPGNSSRSTGGCPRPADSSSLVSRSVACCQACEAVFQIAFVPGTSQCLLTSLPAGGAEVPVNVLWPPSRGFPVGPTAAIWPLCILVGFFKTCM